VILDTCGCKLLLPGVSDPATLEMAEKLAGLAMFRETSDHPETRHPIAPAEVVRQLPDGRALALRAHLSPAIITLPMAWKDAAYRKARRAGTAVAMLTAGAEIAVEPDLEPELPALPAADLVPAGPDLEPEITDQEMAPAGALPWRSR
jgi:hypothetical protein